MKIFHATKTNLKESYILKIISNILVTIFNRSIFKRVNFNLIFSVMVYCVINN